MLAKLRRLCMAGNEDLVGPRSVPPLDAVGVDSHQNELGRCRPLREVRRQIEPAEIPSQPGHPNVAAGQGLQQPFGAPQVRQTKPISEARQRGYLPRYTPLTAELLNVRRAQTNPIGGAEPSGGRFGPHAAQGCGEPSSRPGLDKLPGSGERIEWGYLAPSADVFGNFLDFNGRG